MTQETLFGPNAIVENRSTYAQLRLQGIQHRRRLSPGRRNGVLSSGDDLHVAGGVAH